MGRKRGGEEKALGQVKPKPTLVQDMEMEILHHPYNFDIEKLIYGNMIEDNDAIKNANILVVTILLLIMNQVEETLEYLTKKILSYDPKLKS